jgi:hypothetical protein
VTAQERLALLIEEAGWSYTQPWRPRFSAAGDCLRLLVYEAMEARRGARPERVRRPVRWNAAAVAGTAIAAWLEECAKRLGARVQVPVVAGNVTGTADIVWDDDGVVWDTKWLGEYAHALGMREPPKRYHTQIGGYARALEKPRYAIVNWNLGQLGKGEKLDILIDEQPTPVDGAALVEAIWDTVDSHATLGELPPRGYPREKCTKLKCRFLSECWGV